MNGLVILYFIIRFWHIAMFFFTEHIAKVVIGDFVFEIFQIIIKVGTWQH